MDTTVWTVLGAVETVLWTVETTDCTGDPDPDPDPGAAGPFTGLGVEPDEPDEAAAGAAVDAGAAL